MKAKNTNIISLTSDYNWTSEGIGVMKGVLLSIAPNCRIIDLCHTVFSYSLINASRQFEMIRFLPVGYHIIVVDPEVGTNRRSLAIETIRGDILIGPDNGIMINAARLLDGIFRVYVLNRRLSERTVFDGRDVFAYNTALLSAGVISLHEIGEEIKENEICKTPLTDFNELENNQTLTVIHINHFGNIILNVKSDNLKSAIGHHVTFASENFQLKAIISFAFADVAINTAVLTDDGYGRYSLAINQGSAQKILGVEIESKLKIKLCD